MITDPSLLLFALFGGHFYFDLAVQGEFMALAKDPTNPKAGVPWLLPMAGHAFIHGAFVAVITGYDILGALEFGFHLHTDITKCRKKISFTTDQYIHLACKVVWWVLAVHCSTFLKAIP